MHTANALKFLQLVCENSYKKASAKQSVLGSDPWEMHSEVGLIGGYTDLSLWGTRGEGIAPWKELNYHHIVFPGAPGQGTSQLSHFETRGPLYSSFFID